MSVDLSLAPVSSLQDIPTMKYYSCSILMNSKTEIIITNNDRHVISPTFIEDDGARADSPVLVLGHHLQLVVLCN